MKLLQYPYPILMTYLHAWTSNLGCFLESLTRPHEEGATLTEALILLAFSVLFTLNITISNASLGLVTVALHSLIRATAPFFAILLLTICFDQQFNSAIYYSLSVVVAGVVLATYGDYKSTAFGFWLTLLGSFLAALKTVLTNRILKSSRWRISSSRLLSVCLPLALLQCQASSLGKKEWELFQQQLQKEGISRRDGFLIVTDGILAYLINILSLATNKKVGALSMVVVGNLKQAMAVSIGLVVARSLPSLLHLTGILLTLGGSAWYSIAWLELSRRQNASRS